jgi:hypothetical protein
MRGLADTVERCEGVSKHRGKDGTPAKSQQTWRIASIRTPGRRCPFSSQMVCRSIQISRLWHMGSASPLPIGCVLRLRLIRHDPRNEAHIGRGAKSCNAPFLDFHLANFFAKKIDVSLIAHGIAAPELR